MAPAPGVLTDGGDHSLAELRTVLAERLSLAEDDLQAKIASGTPLMLWLNLAKLSRVYDFSAGR